MQEPRTFSRRVASAAISGLKAARREFRKKPSDQFAVNPLQERFIEWNAERKTITIEESRKRFETSAKQFEGGHAGRQYRSFNSLTYDVFSPFFSDTDGELFESYQFHSRMHFLRMLSYPIYTPDDAVSRLIEGFDNRQTVTILDFGCGLAQISRAIAARLKQNGCAVKLVLADIPTQRKDFLGWLCARDGIEMNFLECTEAQPIPVISDSIDVCVATEFFEHVGNPIEYFDRFNERMSSGAWMMTNVADHKAEYMHVSPDLKALRARVAEVGFEALKENTLFQKA